MLYDVQLRRVHVFNVIVSADDPDEAVKNAKELAELDCYEIDGIPIETYYNALEGHVVPFDDVDLDDDAIPFDDVDLDAEVEPCEIDLDDAVDPFDETPPDEALSGGKAFFGNSYLTCLAALYPSFFGLGYEGDDADEGQEEGAADEGANEDAFEDEDEWKDLTPS